jgi:hypothetical protein
VLYDRADPESGHELLVAMADVPVVAPFELGDCVPLKSWASYLRPALFLTESIIKVVSLQLTYLGIARLAF